MWPIILNALRIYAPYILLPVTMTVGYVGYNLEDRLFKNVEKKSKSLIEERADRNLDTLEADDPTKVATLKEKAFVTKSTLEVNRVRES